MTDAPTEFIDFEFAFTNGQLLTVTAQLGRDTIDGTPDHVRLFLHPSPGVHEEVLVTRSALSYMRTTQRTVAPERQTDGFTLVTEAIQLPQDRNTFERETAVFNKLKQGSAPIKSSPLNLPTVVNSGSTSIAQDPL